MDSNDFDVRSANIFALLFADVVAEDVAVPSFVLIALDVEHFFNAELLMCILGSSDRWFGAKLAWVVSDVEGPNHQMLWLLFLLVDVVHLDLTVVDAVVGSDAVAAAAADSVDTVDD